VISSWEKNKVDKKLFVSYNYVRGKNFKMKIKVYHGSLRCQKPEDYVLLKDLEEQLEMAKDCHNDEHGTTGECDAHGILDSLTTLIIE
jgi:hypothetical protein